jgi:dTDP-4-amino-4,6-dideoxygalactose transaminase
MRNNTENIYITRPVLPPLEEYIQLLQNIWDHKWLTNNGRYHREFEGKLCEHLGVKNCSLFANGTLALVVGLQALRITGEVITTPFSFVATTHALQWNGIQPVFCDIEDRTMNMDPEKVESLITPKTTALLPVHVYGHPCDINRYSKIADRYGLKLIYDAAHAFNVKVGDTSVLNYGDLSVLSFHATKTFNTAEGGAIITNDDKLKSRIDFLKNFGFADEVTVVAPGINAKMNEIQAALGILQLKIINKEIDCRKEISARYRKLLDGVEGITFMEELKDVTYNYSYFPILVNSQDYGKNRDDLYKIFRSENIFTRRYFYPLISNFPFYRSLLSASPEHLPVANKIANQVLCLPIYGELENSNVKRIVNIIKNNARL